MPITLPVSLDQLLYVHKFSSSCSCNAFPLMPWNATLRPVHDSTRHKNETKSCFMLPPALCRGRDPKAHHLSGLLYRRLSGQPGSCLCSFAMPHCRCSLHHIRQPTRGQCCLCKCIQVRSQDTSGFLPSLMTPCVLPSTVGQSSALQTCQRAVCVKSRSHSD